MPDYIVDPLVTDEALLITEAIELIREKWPNWTPSENDLTLWMIRAGARMNAETRDVGSDVPPAIFRYFGTSLLGFPPAAATPATVQSVWTIDNPDGRTIEAGLVVGINDDSGDVRAFEVVADQAVPAGTTSVVVPLQATEDGSQDNGLGGSGVAAERPALSWVSAVALQSTTGGGIDEESEEAYRDRLARRLTLLAPRPIVPNDFAVLAVDLAREAGENVRVAYRNLYNPANDSSSNERMIALAMVNGDTGEDVTTATKAAVDAGLQARREVNFVVHVVDPTRTTIDVTFTGKSYPGKDPVAIRDSAVANLTEYLRPKTFGTSGDEGSGWTYTSVVRRQDISAVLNNTLGFDYWTALTINGSTAESISLSGAFPLTQPGTISGTITGG